MFLEIGVIGVSNSLAEFKDSYLAANPGTTLTNAQWATLMNFQIYPTIFFYVVFMGAIGFVGLYLYCTYLLVASRFETFLTFCSLCYLRQNTEPHIRKLHLPRYFFMTAPMRNPTAREKNDRAKVS
jgi:hypothetical protein